MPELSAPLRVTWDLPEDPDRAARLWGRLAEGRVLFAEVRVGSGSLPGLAGLAATPGGAAAGRAPRLTVLGEPETLLAALEALGLQALAGCELQMLPPFEPGVAVEELAAVTRRLVPSLWSTPEGLGPFAEALEIARGCRLASVAILNPPAPAPPLGPAHRAEAAKTWRAQGGRGLELRCHDLFLAEELGLSPFEGYRGCQAAGALAHVTQGGRLTACRTICPEAGDLGDLGDHPLAELWAGARRRELRARLAAPPTACAPCALAASCAGGCRGLSPELGQDPSCPGVRGAGGSHGRAPTGTDHHGQRTTDSGPRSTSPS
jgi:radical SAM protein with 4Fe4S-binding SPASM domain